MIILIGCFGGDMFDSYRERQLDEYLNRLDEMEEEEENEEDEDRDD